MNFFIFIVLFPDTTVNGLFKIDQNTGQVSILKDIDREDLLDHDAVVTLTVKVTVLISHA